MSELDKSGPDVLDRLMIRSKDRMDYLEMERAMRKNWKHAYSPTDKQVDALMRAHNQRIDEQRPIRYKPRIKRYWKSLGGKEFPALASAGIVRKTYRTRGTRTTRYIVPGRAGLFSLGSARKLFAQL